MTERNVSREQSIALHLARVMGLWHPRISGDKVAVAYEPGTDAKPYFDPHHDRAQAMEVIEWAAVNGYGPTLEDRYCLAFDKDIRKYAVKNDGTPEGVRDAALEAIALATGWPGMEGE